MLHAVRALILLQCQLPSQTLVVRSKLLLTMACAALEGLGVLCRPEVSGKPPRSGFAQISSADVLRQLLQQRSSAAKATNSDARKSSLSRMSGKHVVLRQVGHGGRFRLSPWTLSRRFRLYVLLLHTACEVSGLVFVLIVGWHAFSSQSLQLTDWRCYLTKLSNFHRQMEIVQTKIGTLLPASGTMHQGRE